MTALIKKSKRVRMNDLDQEKVVPRYHHQRRHRDRTIFVLCKVTQLVDGESEREYAYEQPQVGKQKKKKSGKK
jgi:hypothetical protein